jgi:hypothetical protein
VRAFGPGAAFAGLLALQVLPSAWLAWEQTQRLDHGRPVALAVETRDPRDLLRGEYSVLAYEIGRLQGVRTGTKPPGCDLAARESCRLEAGRVVYLRLSVDAQGIHRPEEVLFAPPKDDALVIRGRLRSATLVRELWHRALVRSPGRAGQAGSNGPQGRSRHRARGLGWRCRHRRHHGGGRDIRQDRTPLVTVDGIADSQPGR